MRVYRLNSPLRSYVYYSTCPVYSAYIKAVGLRCCCVRFACWHIRRVYTPALRLSWLALRHSLRYGFISPMRAPLLICVYMYACALASFYMLIYAIMCDVCVRPACRFVRYGVRLSVLVRCLACVLPSRSVPTHQKRCMKIVQKSCIQNFDVRCKIL